MARNQRNKIHTPVAKSSKQNPHTVDTKQTDMNSQTHIHSLTLKDSLKKFKNMLVKNDTSKNSKHIEPLKKFYLCERQRLKDFQTVKDDIFTMLQ